MLTHKSVCATLLSAGEWLKNISDAKQVPEDVRDQAVREFARVASDEDVSAGLQWAMSIADAGLRKQSLRQIIRNHQQDADFAQGAKDSGLTPELMAEAMVKTKH